MHVEATQRKPFKTLLSSLLQGGLSYLRWTQTVPMILAWSLALFTMLAALFVGFQKEGFSMLIGLNEAFPELSDWLGQQLQDSGAVTATESDGMQFTLEPLVPWVLRGWGIIAALLTIVEWLKHRLRPSASQPRSLRRKLVIALWAVVIVLGIMVVGSSAAGADAAESVLPLILMGVLLFGVSAYSLSVGHLIGKIGSALDEPAEVIDQDEFLSVD